MMIPLLNCCTGYQLVSNPSLQHFPVPARVVQSSLPTEDRIRMNRAVNKLQQAGRDPVSRPGDFVGVWGATKWVAELAKLLKMVSAVGIEPTTY